VSSHVKLAPLGDRLVVQVLSQEKKTAGGLYIPETSQMAGHLEGQVLSVGPGKKDKKGRRRPTDVKVGDRILFSEYAGMKTDLGGKEVRILSETEVLGILDK
jgi:chaperonin GroES